MSDNLIVAQASRACQEKCDGIWPPDCRCQGECPLHHDGHPLLPIEVRTWWL